MSKSLVLVLLGLAFCVTALTPRTSQAITLGSDCERAFIEFKSWPEYYKVFVYSRRGNSGRYTCRYARFEKDALKRCNETAAQRGLPKCRVYARSPVDGGVKVVWKDDGSARLAMVKHSERSLAALCFSTAELGDNEWTKSGKKLPNIAEVLSRGGSKSDCEKIMGISIAVEQPTSNYLAGRPLMALCRNAARNAGQEWRATRISSSIYVAELRRRGINEQDCKDLLAGKILIKTAVVSNVTASTTDPPVEPMGAQASAAMQKKHKHAVAVIIGNRKYQDGVPEVSFAHNDANAISRFLVHSLGYRKGNIIDLRDATQSKLMAVFGTRENHKGKLYSYVRPNKSDVTIFYSGHGAPGLNDRKGYLLPVDGDPNLIEFNGYPIDLLLENVAKIETRSTTVLMDACFSGDSPKGMIVRAVSGISVTPRLPAASDAMTVITAARGSQFASWDEEARLGLFTNHLLKAFRGAADGEEYGNGDGLVTLAEVRAYLDDEMTYQARRRYNRDQNASIQGSPETILVGN